MSAAGERHRRAALVQLHAKGGRKGKKGNRRGEKDDAPPEDALLILPADGMTLTEVASKFGKPPAGIITYFFAEKGTAMSMNDVLNKGQISDVAAKYGIDVIFDDEEEAVSAAANRGFLAEELENAPPRPPVVTVMGHVDHGKTTLLDTIRSRSVAASEAGGITQRIGAYTVKVGNEKATFIDTPGHEAFTAMRARGAQVTDIAVLVVAADDGVMPQTREAIAHAKAAEVPIIVAINKCDLPQAQADRTRQALADEGLVAEEWGGDIPMLEVSAKKNIGIDSLLELITLTAEVRELKGAIECHAAGVVLESTFEQAKGTLATLLVQKGMLRVGDIAVAGRKLCRVRAMMNEAGTELTEVPPSMACQVVGFDGPPEAGDQFEVYSTVQEAREIVERREKNAKTAAVGFHSFTGKDSDKMMRLAIILKTDAQGSIAAVKQMFSTMKDSKYVNIRWVLAAPGPITDSDVELASTCPKDQKVMILGFNTTATPTAVKDAKARSIQLSNFKVIYELFETIVAALEDEIGMEEQLIEKGQGEILAVFSGRFGNVAGCKVLQGQLIKGNRVKVFRKNAVVGEGAIISLREGKEDVVEVDEENECGFSIEGWDAWEQGDKVRCYEVNMVTPDLIGKRAGSQVNKSKKVTA